MEKDLRIITIMELKDVMKRLATINEKVSEMNKDYLKNATEEIKTLCELLNY